MLIVNDENVSPNPAWRWERAREIADGAEIEVTGDRLVLEATEFWRQRRAAEDDEGRRRFVIARFPAAFEAYELFRRREPTRYAIEAFVVCGVELAEIAQVVGLSLPVVEKYVALFFDVTQWVGTPAWGHLSLITDDPDDGSDLDYSRLWKKLAAVKGPRFLAAFIGIGDVAAEDLRDMTNVGLRQGLAASSLHMDFNNVAGALEAVWPGQQPENMLEQRRLKEEATTYVQQLCELKAKQTKREAQKATAKAAAEAYAAGQKAAIHQPGGNPGRKQKHQS